MRVLVTGADGFVGPHLLNELNAHGHEATGVALSDGDLTDEGFRRELLKDLQPGAVVHLAALSGHRQCEEDPERARWINMAMPVDLARDLADVVPGAAYLFVSTGKVYAPAAGPIAEDGGLEPPDVYAQTKLEAENALLALDAGLRVLVARPFNHTGPGQQPGFLCPDLVGRLRSSTEDPAVIEVGSLDSVVDISDVRDVVHGYRLFLEAGAEGSVLNFGSGRGITVGDVIAALSRATGRLIEPRVATTHDRGYTGQARVGSIDRAGSVLGWKPSTSLEITLADLWKST